MLTNTVSIDAIKNKANTTRYACRCFGRALADVGIVVLLNLQRARALEKVVAALIVVL